MSDAASPLYVESRGRDPGPGVETFVLLHGFGATGYSWRHWVPGLERLGRVLVVDLKGFGASDKPDDGRYGPADQAPLVRRLIELEDPEHVTLVGHSFGGGVALLTALSMIDDEDPRLHRLVLVASPAYPQRLPPFVTLARFPRLAGAGLRLIGPKRVTRVVMRSIVHDKESVDREQVSVYAAALESPSGVRAMVAAAQQLVPDELDRLTASGPRIDVPTLLIYGRGDRVIPLWVGQRLSQELPRAHLEVIEECGHIPHEEHPKRTWEIVERFLRTGSLSAT